MAELAGVPVGAPEQLAGDDDAGPDADLAGDVHVVAEGGPVPEPQLAQGGHVGLVLDQDRGAGRRHPAGQQPAQRDVAPAEVGGAGHRARLLVDQAGHGHAGGRDGQALGRGRGHRGPGQAGQQLGHGRRVAGPVVADLDELDPGAPGQVDHAGGQVVDVDLQAQPGKAVAGQGEGGARPAKVAAALGALLDHQAGRAQLGDDAGHRRLGQAGAGGQLGPGDGLEAGHRVEDKGPVPVAHLPRAQRQVTRRTGHGQRSQLDEKFTTRTK